MDTSNNIIKFPLIKKGNSKQIEPEEIENNLTMIKYNHIGETLALIIPILFNNLELAGFISSENDVNVGVGSVFGISHLSYLKSSFIKLTFDIRLV